MFVSSAFLDKDEPIVFLASEVKGQHHQGPSKQRHTEHDAVYNLVC